MYLHAPLLCRIWVFADFRGISELGNAVVDMLHGRTVATMVMHASCISYVYKNTTGSSKLRAYLVHLYIKTADLQLMQHKVARRWQSVDFLHEVLPQVARKDDGFVPKRKDLLTWKRCQWHDHSGPGGKLRLNHHAQEGALVGIDIGVRHNEVGL